MGSKSDTKASTPSSGCWERRWRSWHARGFQNWLQGLLRRGSDGVSGPRSLQWGRTGGKMFGIEQWDVEPDVMTFAKGMANGVPVGGTITRPEIADSVRGLSISTFGGNPVTCAAALATLEVIESEGLVANAARRGRQLREGLEALQEKYPIMGEVRGMGLMQAVEMVGPDKAPSPEAVARLFELTRRNGLLIGKGGLMGNVVRITPALNVTRDQVAEALARLDRSMAQMGL